MTHQPSKTVRSDLLVHWTGRCIQRDHKALDQPQREKYIKRLCQILDHGLWMTYLHIDIFHEPSDETLSYWWPGTCFTEIKLPQAKRHIGYYGCLGFGFTREFVMKRYGAPVLYVSGTKERKCKGAGDCISPHFFKLLRVLTFFEHKTFDSGHLGYTEFTKFIQDIKLEQFLQDKSLDKRPAENIFAYLSSSIITCALFVKKMSDEKCENAYQRLDEAEWRIPWTTKLEELKVDPRMVNVNPPLPGVSKQTNPAAKIPFCPSDLEVLVLPDECTRKMVLDNHDILNRFGTERPRIISRITTVADCLNDKFDPNAP